MLSQKARPQFFSEIAGQRLAVETLKAIVKKPNESPRSLLLCGEYGTGKTTDSRIFAKALNCPNRKETSSEPCGQSDCPICSQDINNCSFYQEYDATIVGNVETIRNLRDTFYYNIKGQKKVIVFDECFTYDTPILTVQGDKKVWEKIGDIVNKTRQLDVVCVDANGNISVNPIVGWHKLKHKSNAKRYYFRRTDKIDYYHTKGKEVFIEATPNHPVYIDLNTTTSISSLSIGDKVLGFDDKNSIKRLNSIKRKHSYYKINEECYQILLGCLLGDGSLGHQEHDTWNPRFIFSQSKDREVLFNRVKAILGDLFSHESITLFNDTKSTYSKSDILQVRSKCREELRVLAFHTYNNSGGRRIHKDLFKVINPIGLAFHFMCDGSYTGGNMQLSLHRYTRKEVQYYQDFLKEKYGINTLLKKDIRCFDGKYKDDESDSSRGYYIRTNTYDDFTLYASLIAPYLTEDCMYKINNIFECQDLTKHTRPIHYVEPTEFNIAFGEYELVKITDIREDDCNSFVYDLTIEGTHNYIANHILVHNCHTASKAAQSALLKVLEEAPKDIFFLFPTTHAHQLLPTIVSRSLEIRFDLISREDMIENLFSVSEKFNLDLSKDNEEDKRIVEVIANRSKGHARNAHMLLDSYVLLGKENFLASVKSSREPICRYLVSLIRKDDKGVLQAVTDMMTFPLADLKDDFNQVILNVVKGIVIPSETPEGKIAKALGINALKISKTVSEAWFKNSQNTDIEFSTALLSLYSMFNQGRVNQTNTSQVRGK